jgi:hypothetical protein
MKYRTLAIIGALVIGSCFVTTEAVAQAICGNHNLVIDNLQQAYAEAPISMGVTSGGAVIEVFASAEGTWTLVITQPNGVSCLIAAGQDWEQLPKLAAGAKT